MTIEIFKKAESLLKKAERMDELIKILNAAKPNDVQLKKSIDLVTNIGFCDSSENPMRRTFLTTEEIEVIKNALKNEKKLCETEVQLL